MIDLTQADILMHVAHQFNDREYSTNLTISFMYEGNLITLSINNQTHSIGYISLHDKLYVNTIKQNGNKIDLVNIRTIDSQNLISIIN